MIARLLDAIRIWLTRHAQNLFSSLGNVWEHPGSSLLTAAVIGIALAMPTGLSVMIDNAQSLSGAWDTALRMSVFMLPDTPIEQAEQLAVEIRGRSEVEAVTVVTPDAALAEFRDRSGFGEALDLLEENPLPALLIVQPSLSAQDVGQLRGMADELGADPRVDQVVLDSRWLERFQTMVELVRRGLMVLTVLLALAVMIIVGNTIRLDIQNHRQEIEVIKLVGGTDAFIRRPFLYSGLWYGLLGGLLAFLLVTVSLWILAGPVGRLAALYGSGFQLQGLSLDGFLALLATGAGLGWVGSWLAVGRHIAEIEPE
jgi:cell division transport system permease protein